MKTLEDLKDYTKDELVAHIASSYEVSAQAVDKFDFLLAYESVGSWGCDSTSFFLMRDDEGKLFEVNGGHCSCYGFEGQWEPEETSKEALQRRSYISLGGYDNSPEENRREITEVIEALPSTEGA